MSGRRVVDLALERESPILRATSRPPAARSLSACEPSDRRRVVDGRGEDPAPTHDAVRVAGARRAGAAAAFVLPRTVEVLLADSARLGGVTAEGAFVRHRVYLGRFGYRSTLLARSSMDSGILSPIASAVF
jgi:hypothetical protein